MAWRPFSSKSEKQILNAIAVAEETCSGEIRVHIDQYCKGDPVYKAQNLFFHLEMEQTELRNGVLIYVALKDKKFAIIGDEGIDKKVGENFWDSTKKLMLSHFKNNDINSGIITAIQHAGEQLSKHFPADSSKGNELSNDISYGE